MLAATSAAGFNSVTGAWGHRHSQEYHVLAYDFPLLGVIWSLFVLAMFFLWVFIVIWCFIDNFRRTDHHGGAKALWFLFIVFVPVIGVLAYIITRPADPMVVVVEEV
jgi:phage shock protein PspC (stress-responsive transcriptional regulator)